MKFVVLSRDSYNGCNCSCFEVDEVFGPFKTEKEANNWVKEKKNYFHYRVLPIKEKSNA